MSLGGLVKCRHVRRCALCVGAFFQDCSCACSPAKEIDPVPSQLGSACVLELAGILAVKRDVCGLASLLCAGAGGVSVVVDIVLVVAR